MYNTVKELTYNTNNKTFYSQKQQQLANYTSFVIYKG